MFDSTFFARHLEDDEVVTVIAHKHWVIGAKQFCAPIFSLLLALTVLSVAKVQPVFYVAALWGIASIVWLLRNFLDYYLDAWIITNQGVIDLEWHGWFHRESARILYSDIQGVSYEIKGVLGTLLRYGQVSIEKISTGASVSLPYVPNPRKVEAIILRNMETYLHSKNLKDAKHVQEVLAGIVAGHIQAETFAPKPAPTGAKLSSAPKKKGFQSSAIGSSRPL